MNYQNQLTRYFTVQLLTNGKVGELVLNISVHFMQFGLFTRQFQAYSCPWAAIASHYVFVFYGLHTPLPPQLQFDS